MQRVTIKKWANRTINTFLYITLAVVLLFALSSKISGGTPKILGYELLTVLSGSMEPTIHTGSVIAIQPSAGNTTYQKGDVITFRSADNKDTLITHRIAEVKGSGAKVEYVTRGDANDAQDAGSVIPGQVVGKYANFTIPLLGYIFTFAKSTAGVVILLLVPGVLLIGWQVVGLWRMLTRLETDKNNQAPDEPSQLT